MRFLRASLLVCTLLLLLWSPSALAQQPKYNQVPNVVQGERFSKPEPPKAIDFPLGTRQSVPPGGLPFTGADLTGAVLLGVAAIGTGIVLVRVRRAGQ